MKFLNTIFPVLLLSLATITTSACTGTITDGSFSEEPKDKGDVKSDKEVEEEIAICLGNGDPGGTCEVSAECTAPLVCLNGTCVGPKDNAYTCDVIDGVVCQTDGESCVNGLCVKEPGVCKTLDDCPLGFLCQKEQGQVEGQCKPERDGAICDRADLKPALSGVYETDSVLHLREALPEEVDKFLDIAEDARKIIKGDVDLGLPSYVEFVVGAIVANVIKAYVPTYAIAIVEALATMSEVLNTMEVEGTLTLDGQSCDDNYRGSHKWNYITLVMNGRKKKISPDELPGVKDVVPEEFDARYHCGDLLIGKHRIKESLSGFLRWALDVSAQALTPHDNIEDALLNMIDCEGVANTINDSVTGGYGPAKVGCDILVQAMVAKILEAIDKATLKLALMKLSAVVPVNDDGSLEEGVWYGSLVGSDFRGTLKTTKNTTDEEKDGQNVNGDGSKDEQDEDKSKDNNNNSIGNGGVNSGCAVGGSSTGALPGAALIILGFFYWRRKNENAEVCASR